MALAKADSAALSAQSQTTATTTTIRILEATESADSADAVEPATVADLSSNDLEENGAHASPQAEDPSPTVNESPPSSAPLPEVSLPAASLTDQAASTVADKPVTQDTVPGFSLSKVVAAAARSIPHTPTGPVEDSTQVISDGGDLLAAEVEATRRSLPKMTTQGANVHSAVTNSLLRLRASTLYSSQSLTDPWSSSDDARDADALASTPATVDTSMSPDSPPEHATVAASPEDAQIKTSGFDIEKAEEQAAKWENHFHGASVFLQNKFVKM
jgi:hypothetical protein